MKISTSEAVSVLTAADNMLLVTHRSPDGDTAGSAVALCMALRSIGKNAYINRDPFMTPKLRPYTEPCEAPEGFEPQFVCALDCASARQICDASQKYAGTVALGIDHHPSNDLYAEKTLLVAEAAANAEIVYDVIRKMGVSLTRELAMPLYIGLATDTGCFRYADITPHTLHCAADMIATGIDFYSANRLFFEEKSRARLELERRIYSRIEYHGDAVFSYYTCADVEETNADDDDRNNLASVLMSIQNVKLSLLVRENSESEWKLSARSVPGVNAGSVCTEFGGGGHVTAAGASLSGSLESVREALLAAAEREIVRCGLNWA